VTACAPAPGPWFPVRPDPAAAVRLYCFPFAGGGVPAFQAWRELLPAAIDCVPVRLPGRETRLREPAATRVEPLVEALTEVAAEALEPPYALYGHSMGALVAFELARSLRRAGHEPPLGLIVSGRPAPHVPMPGRSIHSVSDDELIRELRALGGLPDVFAANPALLAFFLPLLRADLAVNEAYEHRPEPPLDIPLTALAGAADPRVRAGDVSAWGRHTTGDYRFQVLVGGHFFPFDDPAPTLRVIASRIDGWRIDNNPRIDTVAG
jgi:medium-chain acyl-[acyl-carrier-protein] hydrolase